MQNTLKALIASNDDALLKVAYPALQQLHCEAVTAHSDAEALQDIREEKPSLIILDAGLPVTGGLEFCRRLRRESNTADIPIIIVTAEESVPAKIAALETGADDCVTRPLQADELAARIKAVRRRALSDFDGGHLRAGPIDMDLDRWTATVDGEPLDLTKMEYRLLRALLEAKGRALTRDFLLEKAWSNAAAHSCDTRTVDVHIGRLRRKLGAVGRRIITIRNVGFRFDIFADWISGRGGH